MLKSCYSKNCYVFLYLGSSGASSPLRMGENYHPGRQDVWQAFCKNGVPQTTVKKEGEKSRASQKCDESRPLSGRKNMIKLVAQIVSKMTACCHKMQPIGIRFVISMLATGADRKTALVRIFWKIKLCKSNC